MHKKIKLSNSDLDIHRWEVRRNIWDKKDLNTLKNCIRKMDQVIEPKDYALRGDNNRLMLPGNMLTKGCVKKCIRMTESLNLVKSIGNLHVFITRSGAKEQSFHNDTEITDAVSVIHVITKRFICIKDKKGEHLIKMNTGDILLMHGDCCHAGAGNYYDKTSYAVFVPVGFTPSNTIPCKNIARTIDV